MFDFFSSLGPYVDMAAKFLFGDDRSPGGEGKNEGAAGFLARTFLDTQGSASERRQEEAIRMDIPKLGTGARARVQGVAQGRPFVGSSNERLLNAFRKDFASYKNPQFRTIMAQVNRRPGQRNIAVGSTNLPGVKPIAAASPVKRTDTKAL
jgi:hypothetical protein